jgi:hypothetical protein
MRFVDSKTPLPPGYRRMTEDFPLPSTREKIVELVKLVLNMGGVQRLVIDAHQGKMIARRAVKNEEAQMPGFPTELLEQEDLFASARNAEMRELDTRGYPPLAVLFRAFHLITQPGLEPRAFVVNTLDELRRWLGLDELFDLRALYGVEVVESRNMPPESLLLVAHNPAAEDPDRVVFSLRMSLLIDDGQVEEQEVKPLPRRPSPSRSRAG